MKLSILMPVYNERTVVDFASPRCSPARFRSAWIGKSSWWMMLHRRHVDIPSAWPPVSGDTPLSTRPELRGRARGSHRHRESFRRFRVDSDADLEYDPSEYPRLLRPLLDGQRRCRLRSDTWPASKPRAAVGTPCQQGPYSGLQHVLQPHLTDMRPAIRSFARTCSRAFPFAPTASASAGDRHESANANWRIYESPYQLSRPYIRGGKKIKLERRREGPGRHRKFG